MLRGQLQNGRVEFHVVRALEAGVLQRLGQAAVDAAADEQQALRRGMLEQRVVDGLFRLLGIGRGDQRQAVLVKGRAAFPARYHQAPVNGVARVDELKATPQPGERRRIHPRGGEREHERAGGEQ